VTGLASLAQQGGATWLFIPSAVALGALHGLEPGHSKTMMAAFIVAIRGTIGQAALLAITATVSHTAIVWIIAILGLIYGSQWSFEATEPYLQLASGVIVITVALWVGARTWLGSRAARAAAAHQHNHHPDERKVIDTGHGVIELSVFEQGVPPRFRVRWMGVGGTTAPIPPDAELTVETVRPDGKRQQFRFARRSTYLEAVGLLPEPHVFTATITLGHGGHVRHGGHAHAYAVEFAEHAQAHSHGGLDIHAAGYEDAHERAHAQQIRARFINRGATTGQIAIFGLTGGLLPCPAAVTVLLLCLQLNQFWLGIVLVLSFSIGLALTLLASGAIAAWGVQHTTRRWPGVETAVRRLPYLSSALIVAVGLYVAWSGWIQLV
jgi:nickel/cobalt transporter (NicO) family protein